MMAQSREPTFVELFTPKLITILRESYGLGYLRADIVAGLTVAIVALPLSMAIAIAFRRHPRPGALRGHRRRLHRVSARRQPVPSPCRPAARSAPASE